MKPAVAAAGVARQIMRASRLYLAAIAIVGAFIWASWKVGVQQPQTDSPQTVVLRISHFQLEASVRDAFDTLAEDYRRDVNPHVRIVQEAIPDGMYGQWASSQLVGGMAPDLMEIGYGRLAHTVWISYFSRYFVPLTAVAARANPHNRGTELEGIPLKQTYLDGMRFGYTDELQEIMTVPMSQFSARVFYNRDLLEKLTGARQAPNDYRQFLKICDKIAAQRDASGRPYVPIAASPYHLKMWDDGMLNPLTYNLLGSADLNRDGVVGADETFVAFKTGAIGFDSPAIKAKFQLQREVMDRFQPGFVGMTRDEAMFLFAQQRAVFISTGTWDARSLFEQARDSGFEVGITNFPMPGPSDPEFGSLIKGPVYDRTETAFPLALTRVSKHPEIATDFLLYLVSRKGNERFNQIAGWMPAIRGCQTPSILRGFEPQLQGMFPGWNLNFGGDTSVKWSQVLSEFDSGLINYQQMVAEFLPFYLTRGDVEWDESNSDWRQSVISNEQVLAADRGTALTAANSEDAQTQWRRYRALLSMRELGQELAHDELLRRMNGHPMRRAAPYELTPQAMQNVRADLAGVAASSATAPAQ